MIRVLHVVSILHAGGIENYLLNLYREIDRSIIQFDFLVHHHSRGIYEDEIEKMGGRVFHLPLLDNYNLFRYIRDLRTLFKSNPEIRIIHGHLASLAWLYLKIAKECGIQVRIVHSHEDGHLNTPKGWMKFFLFKGAKKYATNRFACSNKSGVYLFGNHSFDIIPNVIDTKRFLYNEDTRKNIRRQLKIEDDFVIGHVGRFNLQKNHEFLLKVFSIFISIYPDGKLLLCGDGELIDQIKKRVSQIGLEEKVLFLGVREDIEKYYTAMDVFVLPSLFEGFPVSSIEAQISGLPCLFSDSISRDVELSNSVLFLPITNNSMQQWVDALLNVIRKEKHNRNSIEINKYLFDSEIASKKMTSLYFQLLEETD